MNQFRQYRHQSIYINSAKSFLKNTDRWRQKKHWWIDYSKHQLLCCWRNIYGRNYNRYV